MPDANVNVKARFNVLPITVSYIDEYGETKTVTNAINLSLFDGNIPAGSVCSFSSGSIANATLDIGSDITIIIPDDFELVFHFISGFHTVTFYGQEKGNGKLYVADGVLDNVNVYGGNVCIYGAIKGDVMLSWAKPSNSFYAAEIRGSVNIFKTFYDEGGNPYTGPIPGSSVQGKTLRPYDCRLSLNDDAADNSAAIDAANGLVYNVTLSGRTLWKDGA